MNHAELQARVIARCKELDLWWCVADPVRSRAGWPDLVIAGNGGMLFAELKSEDGRRSLAQVQFSDLLIGLAEYELWRPEDWENGTIKGLLERIA